MRTVLCFRLQKTPAEIRELTVTEFVELSAFLIRHCEAMGLPMPDPPGNQKAKAVDAERQARAWAASKGTLRKKKK